MVEDNHDGARGFVGVGSLAAMLGVSPTTVREWEAAGVVPMAGRIEPRSQRVWPTSDLESIKERVATKRAAGRQRGDRVPVAS
jgi:DNA-binding transcriptional MerR regulator